MVAPIRGSFEMASSTKPEIVPRVESIGGSTNACDETHRIIERMRMELKFRKGVQRTNFVDNCCVVELSIQQTDGKGFVP
jgi:hypothetical protein